MKHKQYFSKNDIQLVVPCPNKIRKRILRNLQKSSINKFNKMHAEKALELIKKINAKSNSYDVPIRVATENTKIPMVAKNHTTKKTQRWTAKIYAFVNNMFNKYMKRLTTFPGRKGRFQVAHG